MHLGIFFVIFFRIRKFEKLNDGYIRMASTFYILHSYGVGVLEGGRAVNILFKGLSESWFESRSTV